MRPPSPSIPEREFLLNALRQSRRLDGRRLLDMRKPIITFNEEMGYVEVALGKTKVMAHIESRLVRPPPERPYEGIISIHSEVSPMASSEYEAGRPSEEEVTITRMLDKVIRRSDTVDKESLCILAGQVVWHLRLTLHFLADAGNVLDCACLASIVALRHFRRPEVEVVGEDVVLHQPDERAPVPLAMHHTPFCFTFAFFHPPSSSTVDEIITVLDPSLLEQTLCGGTMSVALNAQRELCVVQKAGGVPLAQHEILHVVNLAVQQAKLMERFVEDTLASDWEKRKKTVEVR
ncbi:ribosomal protein S5 domain 2-like protein [Punctularia strigosozonata HHB-11173 SS5]|uniref:Ribosomal protein S5 domain 2-like protein n=1 Tax=Punctularia strigosozonata (strain HHB-11173) TaxID=741275 RepID=R7S585_PUNST|nr:ribosomal protein S5 domain 2-like protein [Punctularia strigosozonata HHB-11173 SS5]EIN04511.1 ribosomal protein S5 domain 2-like protein [Punctularia strigosozonata HHB-11173 SS5]